MKMAILAMVAATIFFAGQFVFTKIYESATRQTVNTALLMLVVTSITGAVMYFAVGGFSVQFSAASFVWAAIFGLVMIPYYVIGIKVLSLGSLAVYSLFMMLGGMLVPLFYGVIFLKERITLSQGIGSVLLVVFIILQSLVQKTQTHEQTENKKGKALYFILCIAIFMINGLTGVIAKAHELEPSAVDESSFMVVSCLITAILSAAILFVGLKKAKPDERVTVSGALKIKPLLSAVLIGVFANSGNFFNLIAARDIPASIQFSAVSGGVIILSVLTSAVIFKEKISNIEKALALGILIAVALFVF